MEKNECPDYFEFKSLTGRSKTIQGERLRGKICNTKPDKLCCKQTGPSFAKSFLPASDQCGVSCLGTKSVFHGENAGEFPWAALLGTDQIIEQWDNRQREWINKTEKIYHC